MSLFLFNANVGSMTKMGRPKLSFTRHRLRGVRLTATEDELISSVTDNFSEWARGVLLPAAEKEKARQLES